MILYLAGTPYDCEGFRWTVWNSGATNLLFTYAHEPKHGNIRRFITKQEEDMLLYLAGSLSPERLEIMADKANAKCLLETYAHKDARQCAMHLAPRADMRLFIDSGAFTAWRKNTPINLDEYIKFCKEMMAIAKCKLTFAALDVISDGGPNKFNENKAGRPGDSFLDENAERGWENYLTMRKAGVPAVMTFHQFEKLKHLKKYIADNDYICLSQNKSGLISTEAKAEWFRWVFKQLPPKYKTHGLGVSSPAFMEEFPFYSVDSTAWLQGGRSGAYRMFNGRRAELCPPAEWPNDCKSAKLPYLRDSAIVAKHRYRPQGWKPEMEPGAVAGEVGIYFFAMTCMKRDVKLGEHVTQVWRERGIEWEA